jgi:hypothetical protein
MGLSGPVTVDYLLRALLRETTKPLTAERVRKAMGLAERIHVPWATVLDRMTDAERAAVARVGG